MTRDELVALRDAIDLVLTWPDPVRDEVARWLVPEVAKPNGHDPHPPATPMSAVDARSRIPPRSRPAKTPQHQEGLLKALDGNPAGMSISALAKGAAANRETIRQRLLELAARGAVEKGGDGLWQLKAKEREVRPTPPPSS
jgi:hypothetical protein